MNKKILALDLDDTLLSTDKTISKENISALEKLVEAGHYIAIDTGRPIHGIRKLLSPYRVFSHKNVFFLGYQGVVGYNNSDDSRLFTDYMDSQLAAKLIDLIKENGHTAQAFDETWLYTFEENENVLKYNEVTNEPVSYISTSDEIIDKDICKCMAVDFSSHEKLVKLRDKLEPIVGKDFTMMFSTPYFLEFIKKGASKGNGLMLLATALDIPMENTVACGDERNDISMILDAGVGVAVNNAQQEVKAVADYITDATNDQGAIAEVVYKFFL